MDNGIPKDSDGFYHPRTEDELVALVKLANQNGVELRVRGASHSVAAAIYTDPLVPTDYTVNQQQPFPSNNINVMLDQYRNLVWQDEKEGRVVADAGINLGQDPLNPTSTLDNSLLVQLWNKGWTLSDLGGITHQTISGFISTGSSGGSLMYSVYDNVYGIRLIDGQGEIYEVYRSAAPEQFNAVVTSMGLLGIVSKVYLQCTPAFNITGQEAITTMQDASVDLFGEDSSKPTLDQFLKQVEYTRLEWWPQRKGERIVVWQCQRIQPQPGFRPVRYEEFTSFPELAEIGISIFYTVIGNLDDLDAAKLKLEPTFKEIQGDLTTLFSGWGLLGQILADFIALGIKDGVDAAIDALKPSVPTIKEMLPGIFNSVLDVFVPLDSGKQGMEKNEPQSFRDYAYSGLPMDNQASDILAPTEFTEIWLPIQYSTQAMRLMRDYFNAPTNDQDALQRTGTYAIEIYGARPNPYWMSMSYSSGTDAWRDGVVRVDLYWYVNNAGNPAEVFYPQFWKLFRDAGIPFRLHWGKFQPMLTNGDPDGWVQFFRQQYPRWDSFLTWRQQMDPNNIFLTDYWRQRFGLMDLPRPTPKT